jgi:hypothetical protein
MLEVAQLVNKSLQVWNRNLTQQTNLHFFQADVLLYNFIIGKVIAKNYQLGAGSQHLVPEPKNTT